LVDYFNNINKDSIKLKKNFEKLFDFKDIESNQILTNESIQDKLIPNIVNNININITNFNTDIDIFK